MTGSNFFRHPSKPVSEFIDITTAIEVKTSLKGVFLFFYSLSRLFQLAYSVKCWRTLHEGKAVQWPPRKGNVKKNFRKKGDSWSNSGLPCVVSVLFTPLGEMISIMKSSFPSTVFCVFGRIFHLVVMLNTQIWGSWSKNEPLLQKIPRMTIKKRIKCVYLAILFQIYTGVLST